MNFSDLNLSEPLLRAVETQGYTNPSPIQEQAIPPLLLGRDLLGCAQTGTGKTAAFALPILQRLSETKERRSGKPHIRALVLTPTRELALQIFESFEAYGKHLQLSCAVIFGGVPQNPQVAKLRKGVDILVATPGRLNDLIAQGYIKLGSLCVFVLDEADRMLDMGFVQDVQKIIKIIPRNRQTMLFSATMPDEIVSLADKLLAEPARVFVTPPSTTVQRIEQCVYKVDKANKRRLLAKILKERVKSSVLVFTRTKHGADRVVKELSRGGIGAVAIHGDKSQNSRQNALKRFKDGDVKVLVATDIAARGIDINELRCVINYELPNVPETYVHRIGRTGRAGNSGIAMSFCDAQEVEYLLDIEKLIGFSIKCEENHPWPMQEIEIAENVQKKHNKNKNKEEKNTKMQKKEKITGKQDGAAVREEKPISKGKSQGDEIGERYKSAKHSKGKQFQAPPKQGKKPPRGNAESGVGAQNVVTKRFSWGDEAGKSKMRSDVEPIQRASEPESEAGRNSRRKKSVKPQALPTHPAGKAVSIPKNERGVFDFTEEELAEDKSLKLISGVKQKSNTEAKYANFEDYLKDH